MCNIDNAQRKIKIVEFFHPGGEHLTTYKSSGDKRHKWSKEDALATGLMPSNKGEHRRKFMVNKGRYLDRDMNLSDELHIAFWGEWENPSRFKPIKYEGIQQKIGEFVTENDPNREIKIAQNKIDKYFHRNGIPQYVHYKFLGETEEKHRENTDPYVFGDTFYYCCCKQTTKEGKPKYLQTDLAPGTLILFGSKLNDKFLLDTVFVIKDLKPYSTLISHDLYFKNVLPVTDKYINASLKPLEKSEAVGGYNFMLYSGASFNSKYKIGDKEIFSFFPCKKLNNTGDIEKDASEVAFDRPCLNLAKYSLVLPGIGAPANILENFKEDNMLAIEDEEVVAMYWNMIVEDMFKQGLSLGVYTEEPNHIE